MEFTYRKLDYQKNSPLFDCYFCFACIQFDFNSFKSSLKLAADELFVNSILKPNPLDDPSIYPSGRLSYALTIIIIYTISVNSFHFYNKKS